MIDFVWDICLSLSAIALTICLCLSLVASTAALLTYLTDKIRRYQNK